MSFHHGNFQKFRPVAGTHDRHERIEIVRVFVFGVQTQINRAENGNALTVNSPCRKASLAALGFAGLLAVAFYMRR